MSSNQPEQSNNELIQEGIRKTLEWGEELKTQTDRGVAIVGASMLEIQLGLLLKAEFRKERCSNKQQKALLWGPLGSFWSRTQVANAFGLFPPQICKELDIVREIRNVFAHNNPWKITFDTKEVKELAEQLKIPKGKGEQCDTLRGRFVVAVVELGADLLYETAIRSQNAGSLEKKSDDDKESGE